MTGREDFGPSLRRERERRGITLEQIAERTKISPSLFAAMERNDFSRWPGGIFRRSFLRAYAEVVGINADELVQRFVRLFPSPDDSQAPHGERPAAIVVPIRHQSLEGPRDGQAPRMLLADEAAAASDHPGRARAAATLADVGIVALLVGAGWLLGGWVGMRSAVVFAATLIFVAGSILLGRTPGAWLLGKAAQPPAPSGERPAASTARVIADDRLNAKRRPTSEPHQAARRQNLRRLDRSRSRRA